MAELGLEVPNEDAEVETAEEEAQEAAYQNALRQHREALSPPPSTQPSLPTLDEDTSPPTPPSPSPFPPSLGRLSSTAGLESRDDILDFLAPEFSQRRDDMKKGVGRERLLYFGNSVSSSGSISSIGPSTGASSPPSERGPSLRPQSIMSQESSTSQEKRKSGIFGSFKKGTKSSSIASQMNRSSSASLSTPTPLQSTFTSPRLAGPAPTNNLTLVLGREHHSDHRKLDHDQLDREGDRQRRLHLVRFRPATRLAVVRR